MNLKQALYVRTVAREGSVTAAARKLYVSQPSLSQMIRQAEAEFGVKLFDRSVSPIRLTYAGERYLAAAEIMLNASERLEKELREVRLENSGVLRLGISVQRAIQVLPKAIPWFAIQYPDVSIELVEEGSARLEELVEQGRVDIALGAIESTSPRLEYTLIEREVTGILAGNSSGLASTWENGAEVSVVDAAEDGFVTLSSGHSLRLVQDRLFREAGISPRILLETDSLEVAKRVTVEAGACMLCTQIFVDEYVLRRGRFYPLRNYENNRHFYAFHRKGERLPKYAESFIRIVHHMLENP